MRYMTFASCSSWGPALFQRQFLGSTGDRGEGVDGLQWQPTCHTATHAEEHTARMYDNDTDVHTTIAHRLFFLVAILVHQYTTSQFRSAHAPRLTYLGHSVRYRPTSELWSGLLYCILYFLRQIKCSADNSFVRICNCTTLTKVTVFLDFTHGCCLVITYKWHFLLHAIVKLLGSSRTWQQ